VAELSILMVADVSPLETHGGAARVLREHSRGLRGRGRTSQALEEEAPQEPAEKRDGGEYGEEPPTYAGGPDRFRVQDAEPMDVLVAVLIVPGPDLDEVHAGATPR